MWLEIGTIATKFARGTDDERDWLADYLTFHDATAYHRGAKSDRVCLFNRYTQSFPTGLVDLAVSAARASGYAIERIDHRVVPVVRDPAADLAWLYDYQQGAIDAVAKRGRGILWVPTGGGKTEIFVGLTRAFPARWLFLVHRATLVNNAAARYEKRNPGLEAGRVVEGTWTIPPDARVICASFQTVHQALEAKDPRAEQLLGGAEALAIDECHTIPAATFYATVMKCSAYYRVGFSGTPLARGDQRSTYAIAALGPVIYRIKTETLVERGVLARAKIRVVRCRQRSDKPTWQGVYGEAVVRGAMRNKILVKACERAEKPCLLFVKEIKHGKILQRALERRGLAVQFVYGNAKLKTRERAKRDLVAGRHDVLICSVIFQEGEDIPDLRSVVIGSGGKSVIATLQRIGRGMRTAAGKTEFEVWDVADFGCACSREPASMRHPGCKWLDRHTRSRLNAYTSEGHETVLEEWPESVVQPADDNVVMDDAADDA